MILIADSGSTKTQWCTITNGEITNSCFTSGINPFYQDENTIIESLQNEFKLTKDDFSKVFFYGAGCTPEKSPIVEHALKAYFKIEHIEIQSDLYAAARSLCQYKPGIACILGTGSNSCLYDGKKIAQHVSPLGFIIGDEGSGANLGKLLIADILKSQLPKHLIELFFAQYKTSTAEILDNIYKKPFPNRYLASFTPYLSKNIIYPEIQELIKNAFRSFISRNIMQYPDTQSYPIHFTGSIAFVFRTQLEQVLNENDLNIGTILQTPMSGLIEFHINK